MIIQITKPESEALRSSVSESTGWCPIGNYAG
jgi:hypothetical protein